MRNKKWFAIAGAVAAVIIISGILAKFHHPSPAKPGEKPSAFSGPVKAMAEQADSLAEEGRLLDARAAYQDIVSNHPDYENIEDVEKNLENLNVKIIFSNAQTPETVMHEVQNGDTLGKLAKQYGTTMELIKRSNNLNGNVIRLGQKLRIWKAPFSILVDKSQNILTVKTGDQIIKVYHVSTGTNNITPVGNFTIVNKLVNPTWYKSGAVIPSDSPDNVLGTRWLGFDLPGYGIHGTTDPNAIGQQVTAGCVRMRNEEVEELYDYIPVGTQVKVQD